MECGTTYTNVRRRQAAMTFVEMLVATSVAGVLLAALAALTVFTGRSFASMANYVDLDKDSRHTLDLLTTEIRQADRVLSYATNSLVMTNAWTSNRVSYTYNPQTQMLIRTNGSAVTTNLIQCESFLFSYFTDITIPNTYEQYPATGTNDLKMVQVSWRCFRTVIGRRNTESIQSAKIMIRKQ